MMTGQVVQGGWRQVVDFYRQGFRNMRLGRVLWTIILIKLLLILALGRLFFPDRLQQQFATDPERAAYVLEQLTPTGSQPESSRR